MKRALVLLVVLAALAGGANASVVHVHASISYVKRGDSYERAHLRITRNGAVVLEATVRRLLRGDTLQRVFVRDLDADGEPEAVLDLSTGGAHCCVQSIVYRYQPHRYRSVFHDWGNVDPAYRIVDLDRTGTLEFQSQDDRFAYVFTSFAFSRFPVRIWRFDHGRFLDVTRSFPAAVQSDADRVWAQYLSFRRQRTDVRGALAAWAADMELLGHGSEATERLRAAYRRGELGPRADLVGWPEGRAYLRAVDRYLHRFGYAR
jgi:hypothetical protein